MFKVVDYLGKTMGPSADLLLIEGDNLNAKRLQAFIQILVVEDHSRAACQRFNIKAPILEFC